jgi:hypothetical protein
MEAVRTNKALSCILAISLFTSIGTTPALASNNFIQKSIIFIQNKAGKQLFTNRNLVITISFLALLNICSENARDLTTKISYNTLIGILHVLKQCSFSPELKAKIDTKIAALEAQLSQRSPNQFTGEKLKALLKEFKELVDITKAGIEAYKWLD